MSEHDTALLSPDDLETLAAFVEGRLAGAERDAVVARLATDEDFYEVYTETLRLLEEEEEHEATVDAANTVAPAETPLPTQRMESSHEEADTVARPAAHQDVIDSDVVTVDPGNASLVAKTSPAAGVAPAETGFRVLSMKLLPRQALRRPTLLAAAAMVPIAAGLAFLFLRTETTASQDYLRIVDHDPGLARSVIVDVQGWRRVRGGTTPLPPGLGPLALNTRIGVRQIDLAIAIDIGSLEDARRHAGRLDVLMAGGDFPLPIDYGPLLDALRSDGATPALELQRLRLASDVDVVLRDVPGYHLGLWLQTCRIAAASGDIAYFNRRRTRRAFRKLDVPGLLPDAVAETRQISTLLNRGVTPSDLQTLGEACYALVVAGGNRSAN